MIKSIGAIRDSVLRHIQEQHGGKKPVEFHSLGVLTESQEPGTHLVYSEGSEGSDSGNSVQFRFRVVHLARWLGCWGKLESVAATNPFALVIMAQLQDQLTRKQGMRRLATKTQIASLMYRYRYRRQDVEQVLRIIDWMMALPAELEPVFEQHLIQMEQEHKVAYVTSIERLGEARGIKKGMEKGLRQGKLEGEASSLLRQLVRKFGPLPESLQHRIQAATSVQLETWSLNILDAKTLDEVFNS